MPDPDVLAEEGVSHQQQQQQQQDSVAIHITHHDAFAAGDGDDAGGKGMMVVEEEEVPSPSASAPASAFASAPASASAADHDNGPDIPGFDFYRDNSNLSADEECRAIESAMVHSETVIKEGEYRYLISAPWLHSWRLYARCDIEIPDNVAIGRPGPVDNNDLLEDPSKGPLARLKAGLLDTDFVIIPKLVWDTFCAMYPGSGPAICRPYVQTLRGPGRGLSIERFPLRLRVCTKGARIPGADGTHRRLLMGLPSDMVTATGPITSRDKTQLPLVIVGENWRVTDLRLYLAGRINFPPLKVRMCAIDQFPDLEMQTEISCATDEEKKTLLHAVPLMDDDVIVIESVTESSDLTDGLVIDASHQGSVLASGGGSNNDNDNTAPPSYAQAARSTGAASASGRASPPVYSTYPTVSNNSGSNSNYNNYSSSSYYYSSYNYNKRPSSPDGFREGEADTYGVVGLRNLGNTCYMNSGLQCLSQVAQLRHFFLSGAYKADINLDNPLGWKGKAAEAYAFLTRRLYSPKKYGYIAPSKFKDAVGEINSQFKGFQQQDAQEFIGFLLDALHEDLNRVKKKPPTESVNAKDFATHEAAATEAWARHLLRNQSIIVDIFQGQYRSTVVCCDCGEKSVTFDPFASVSLPLPIVTERVMDVVFVPYSPDATEPGPATTPVMLRVTVPKSGPILELKKAVAKEFAGVDPDLLVVVEVYAHKFYSSTGRLGDESPISEIMETDHIYLYQVPVKQSTPRQIRTVLGLPEPATTVTYSKMKCSVCGDMCYSDEVFRHRKCKDKPLCHDCLINFRLKKLVKSKPPPPAIPPPPPPRNLSPAASSESTASSSSSSSSSSSNAGSVELEVLEAAALEEGTEGIATMGIDSTGEDSRPDAAAAAPAVVPEPEKDEGDLLDEDPMLKYLHKFKCPACKEDTCVDDFIVPAALMSTEIKCDGCYKSKSMSEVYVHKPCFDMFSTLYRMMVLCEGCFSIKGPRNLSCLNCHGVSTDDQWMRMPRRNFRKETPPPEPVVEQAYAHVPLLHRRATTGRYAYDQLFGSPGFLTLSVKDMTERTVYDAVTRRLQQIGALLNPSCLSGAPSSASADAAADDAPSSARASGPVTPPPPLEGFADEQHATNAMTEAEGGGKAAAMETEGGASRSAADIVAALPFSIYLADEAGTTCRHCRKGSEYTYYSCGGCHPIGPVDEPVGWRPGCTIVVRWNDESACDEKALDYVVNHESIQPKGAVSEKGLSLDECFRQFAKPETLSADDPWYCPNCKELRQAIKSFEIWKRPDVLVVHLKRFHVSHGFYFREKIETYVDYPLEMDISEYLCGPQKGSGENMYELVGVVIHFGGMGGGHYIAYTRNAELGKWFEYNDSNTKEMKDGDVHSRDAYCLIYQRKGTADALPTLAEVVAAANASPFDDAAEGDERSTRAGKAGKAADDVDMFDPVPRTSGVRRMSDSDDDTPRSRRKAGDMDVATFC